MFSFLLLATAVNPAVNQEEDIWNEVASGGKQFHTVSMLGRAI